MSNDYLDYWDAPGYRKDVYVVNCLIAIRGRIDHFISVIAAGPEPHLHQFRLSPDMHEQVFMEHREHILPQGDIFCMGSGDGVCSLGDPVE